MIIGIIGATGLVGKAIEESLLKLNILKPTDLVLRYSSSGEDDTIVFKMKYLHDLDYAFLATPNELSREIYQYSCETNLDTIFIDSSSEFRMNPEIPLIVPEVNGSILKSDKHNFISSPNCTTTFLVVLLKALEKCGKIKRVTLSTYQAASGAGIKGMGELILQNKEICTEKCTPGNFAHKKCMVCAQIMSACCNKYLTECLQNQNNILNLVMIWSIARSCIL